MRSAPRQSLPAAAAACALALALALCGCSAGQGAASSPVAAPPASPGRTSASPTPAPSSDARLAAALQALEKQDDVRIGVAARVVGSGTAIAYRGDERFAFDSTGKLFSAALLLRDASDAQLGAIIHYTAQDLVDYSPITSQHVASGMPLRDVIAAALQYSDNTAENLMLKQLGGPAAVQSQLRELGDSTSDVDRTETELNSAIPGDPRDTTTPAQMATDLERFALGTELPAPRRALLLATMRGNTTGDAKIRAGVPTGWTVADKTGSGDYGTSNDVAVITRPGATPIVLTIYTTGLTQDAAPPAALVADVARATVDAVG